MRVEVDSELIIGRADDAPLSIDDAQVSRHHAVVRWRPDGLEVEDLGSTNGTYLNEFRIERPARLHHGDVIRMGTTQIEVDHPSTREATRVAEAAQLTQDAPARPATSTTKPAVASERAPATAAPDATPLPRFDAPASVGSRRIATRQLRAQLFTFGTILVTALVLAVYFALR